MSLEASKAIKRRFRDGNFHKYFCGDGIDVGGGNDSLGRYCKVFPLMKSIKNWELSTDGDGQYLKTIQDNTFDFLHSSHSLEHMNDCFISLLNWIRVVKSKGYLIISVPDEDLYEQFIFPSRFNNDHKRTFTIYKKNSWSSKSYNIIELLSKFDNIEIIKIEKIEEFFDFELKGIDQTKLPNVESCIEIILRKL